MTAIVLFLAVSALALFAAYVSLALAAETDIPDVTPGRLILVSLNPGVPTAVFDVPPMTPPLHPEPYRPVRAEAYIAPSPMLRWMGQLPPSDVTGAVRHVAA